ncbi:DUF3833 family protein [Reyranella soli]|uniref:Lipoprotein n=1 Tax=Reyranella soli TaxID=1230389 RepID=A0A512NLR2_9HYPH|nr:DUF3833 family protein [Reyranella soli]GEP59877.1 hypothetical protein RSO01_70430 [Reyranella soli]
MSSPTAPWPALALSIVSAMLGACAVPPASPANENSPRLVLESFFDGTTSGHGVFINSWTGSRRSFTVAIHGSWDGRVLTLVEDFAFADGQRDRKTWRLEATEPGRYTGTREDVVGLARAWTEGNAVRLEYAVRLGGWTVDFSDVLALQDSAHLVNRATIGKWGVRIGRVELWLRRSDGA